MPERLPQLPQTRLPFLAEAPTALRDSDPREAQLHADPAPSGSRPQHLRRRLLALSLAVMVALPTVIAALYFGLVASDQYAVEVRFAVRGANSTSGADLLGVFSGIPASGSTVTDSYILLDFMHSTEMLEKLEGKVGLRNLYSNPEVDFFSRAEAYWPTEEFLKYWRKMLKAGFDGASQIVAVEVRAFTAEDARRVATAILEINEQLINELSARARDDAVLHAQQEVKRMEERLKINRTALRSFRDTQQEFDPVKKAESRFVIVARLEEDLSKARTRLASLRAFMGDDAPSLTVLRSEIKALEKQVEEERRKGGKAEGEQRGEESLGGLVANYEELVVEREFSEKAYLSALSSLERARIEADRQQRYIAPFVRPTLPQEAQYPRRILTILSVFGISLVLWALGVLAVYAVRDHTV